LVQVEYATLKWIDWYNNRRLMIGLGDVPPAEYEQAHYNAQNGQANVA
jgi:putative transposase